ncbi:MAG TPA: cytochrome c biogenesis protein CcsA [Arenimonas sp.]|nr:cytochrome c biogenesis protein CcsA [Arenimonas sp.]
MTTALGALAALAYLLSALRLIQQRQRELDGRGLALSLATLAVLAHLGLQLVFWRQQGGPDLQFFAALSLVGLGMALLTTGAAAMQRIEALGIVVFPLSAVLLTGQLLAGPGKPSSLDWPLQLHAWLALLAYATLAIAAVMAAMLWVQERALRRRDLQGWWRALPPLTQLESLLFRSLAAGFAVLSLALLTGIVFVADLLAQHLAHKTVLSLLAWVVLAVLLFGRWRWGWRGPRAVKLTLTAMTLLLFAFFGSKFVLELVLQRA